MTHHVTMFSGGVGSWATARRVNELMQPGDRHTLLFADVKGYSRTPHVGEDGDTYRFILEAWEDLLPAELEVVMDGRDIWQVFKDDRFLGNSRLANCSKFLKQKPCREWLEARCNPADTVVYVGIDWTETHRIPAIEAGWAPYSVVTPLTEPPYLDKPQMLAMLTAAGIEIPRLYKEGFPHNNCGGFCVRAGQGQNKKLLAMDPERYAFHEAKEQDLRVFLGKDIAVMRDRRGGTSRPLTMTEFRERVEGEEAVDDLDIGGCGCFVGEEGA